MLLKTYQPPFASADRTTHGDALAAPMRGELERGDPERGDPLLGDPLPSDPAPRILLAVGNRLDKPARKQSP